MNSKITKGFITLSIGLLAMAILNCNSVNTGNSSDLSLATNNQTTSTVQSSPEVLGILGTSDANQSVVQNSGILQLYVSEFQAEHSVVSGGLLGVASVEVSQDKRIENDKKANRSHEGDSRKYSHDNDQAKWITISDYGIDGKLYAINVNDPSTYPLDTFLLPSGNYHRIRINFLEGKSKVFVLENNTNAEYEVKTPSGKESGLKLHGSFTIENNMMTVVSLELSLEAKDRENGKNHDRKNSNKNENKKEDRNDHGISAFVLKYESHIEHSIILPLPVVANVAFSPAAGFYNADQVVSMTSVTSGATICYTADGSMPSCNALAACANGNTYSVPVSVTSSQVLNAMACKTGYSPSGISTSAYTVDKPPVMPTAFSGVAVNADQVDLSWTASTDDLTAQANLVYEICQGSVSGACSTFTPVYLTNPGAVSFSVTGLSSQTAYYFSIRAKDQSGNTSVESAEILVMTGSISSWAVQTGISANSLLSITDGGALKISVGAAGTILSSPNGLNWNREASPVATNINNVSGNGSVFVAVGDAGQILYTTLLNGRLTWNVVVNANVKTHLNGIAANASVFVAVGNSGTILYSRDGQNWISSSAPVANNLRSVNWIGKQFIAVGDMGAILVSLDGVTWSAPKLSALKNNLYGVAGNANQVIVVGQNGVMLASLDSGRSFSPIASGSQNTLSDIGWNGLEYIAVGDFGTILTSPNGNQWKAEIPVTGNNLKHVTGKPGLDGKAHHIVVGDFGTILTN